MTRRHETRGSIPVLRIGSTLLATIQVELRDSVAEDFQRTVLTRIEDTGSTGLLIDITALDMVDSYVARVLVETSKMARLMGTEAVLVGMRPEVAATLVRMGFPVDGVRTALDVDDGLALLGRLRPALDL
jgi:rsbT antagonist protein RsbS